MHTFSIHKFSNNVHFVYLTYIIFLNVYKYVQLMYTTLYIKCTKFSNYVYNFVNSTNILRM